MTMLSDNWLQLTIGNGALPRKLRVKYGGAIYHVTRGSTIGGF